MLLSHSPQVYILKSQPMDSPEIQGAYYVEEFSFDCKQWKHSLTSLGAGRGELLETCNSWRLLVSTKAILAFFHRNGVEAGGGCSDNIPQPHSHSHASL